MTSNSKRKRSPSKSKDCSRSCEPAKKSSREGVKRESSKPLKNGSRKANNSRKSYRSLKSYHSTKSERLHCLENTARFTRSEKKSKSSSHRSNKSRKSGHLCLQSERQSSMSQKSNKHKKEKELPPDGICLIHSRGEIIVKEADLVAVSAMIRSLQSEGRLARTIALQSFSQECIQLLVEYIHKRTIKASVSFFTLAEVLKLTKAFIVEDLDKKMEEVLIDAAMQSSGNLLQALIVNDVSPVTRETEIQLHYLGAWRFLELVRLQDFHKLPPHQFLQIFGSCELNVPHELVAVDAALYWLVGQPKIDFLAPAVFAMVRSTYLGKIERQMIIERLQVLNFPESVVRVLRVQLDSRHNNRICLTPEHIQRRMPRCGVADVSHRPPESSLPLSRPREGLIRKKERNQKRIIKLKSERSDKSHSQKNQKFSKTSKSGKVSVNKNPTLPVIA